MKAPHLSPRIYLDHAATTPVHPDVLAAMLPYFTENFGNPSSIYLRGREALEAIERARRTVADLLGARPREILFTSGGSESDNLTIRGVIRAAAKKHPHIITTPIEHHAVLYTCRQLAELFGVDVTYVPVDSSGMVDPEAIAHAIQPNTELISVMIANNEVGTVQPIAEIGAIARTHGIAFHTDAVQAGGAIALDVSALNVDFLSLSGHKFYGPKGIGILYARDGVRFVPIQTGGGQERNRRAGTEYTAGIVGIARAFELAQASRSEHNAELCRLRDRLLTEIPRVVSGAIVTGHRQSRLPINASFVIDAVEGETLILGLDQAGIEASTGSACTSGSTEASHVLKAMGYTDNRARGSLRLTLGRSTIESQIEQVLQTLPGIVQALRGY
jgi:cysteine desulfurase